jgi:hypothetical protein
MRAAYGAAKAGLISLVQTMAVEWASYNIRVNAIAPGPIVTPRLYDTPQRIETIANSLLPVRKRGVTDDIGKAVLFLASDLASYITGTTLDVDGGSWWRICFPADPAGAIEENDLRRRNQDSLRPSGAGWPMPMVAGTTRHDVKAAAEGVFSPAARLMSCRWTYSMARPATVRSDHRHRRAPLQTAASEGGRTRGGGGGQGGRDSRADC